MVWRSVLSVKAGTVQMGKGFAMGNETYGRNSQLYIYCPTVGARYGIEQALAKHGVTTVQTDYSPGWPVLCVGVTYFKGNGYND